MLRLGETKDAKEKFYGARKPTKIWDVNVDKIVVSKLIQTRTNYKYLIRHLNKIIKPLVLVLSKISGLSDMLKLLMLKREIRTINWHFSG